MISQNPAPVSPDAPLAAVRLRIYLGDADREGHRPLYEAIVLKAREMHLAGATVFRSPMGYGHTSRLHTAKILQLSTDLPIVVEIVDLADRIAAFVPVVHGMLRGGMITTEPVSVHAYAAEPAS